MKERKGQVQFDPPRTRFSHQRTPFQNREIIFSSFDDENQNAHEGIAEARKYFSKMAEIQLRSQVERELEATESLTSLLRKYSVWSAWPESVRWPVSASLISGLIAVALTYVPWNKIPLFKTQHQQIVQLSEVKLLETPGDGTPQQGVAENSADPNIPEEGAEVEGSGDEVGAPVIAPPQKVALVEPRAAHSAAEEVEYIPRKQIQKEPPLAMAPPVSAVPSGATTVPADEKMSEPAEGMGSKDFKPRGFVYRAFMNLENVSEVTPKITQDIRELGGEKAGEVELGWRKGDGSYFHFSITEANEPALVEKLKAYGAVRIQKDPHPRVMPAGRIRMILWVDALRK